MIHCCPDTQATFRTPPQTKKRESNGEKKADFFFKLALKVIINLIAKLYGKNIQKVLRRGEYKISGLHKNEKGKVMHFKEQALDEKKRKMPVVKHNKKNKENLFAAIPRKRNCKK